MKIERNLAWRSPNARDGEAEPAPTLMGILSEPIATIGVSRDSKSRFEASGWATSIPQQRAASDIPAERSQRPSQQIAAESSPRTCEGLEAEAWIEKSATTIKPIAALLATVRRSLLMTCLADNVYSQPFDGTTIEFVSGL